jgi:hypothetical protein
MSAPVLLSRDRFRAAVFARDRRRCVVCKLAGVDAHHILDRGLFPDGGYYLDNGVTVCAEDHLKAEKGEISPASLRAAAGISEKVLPPGFDPAVEYDKWGKPDPKSAFLARMAALYDQHGEPEDERDEGDLEQNEFVVRWLTPQRPVGESGRDRRK